jgi:hypothetical protein
LAYFARSVPTGQGERRQATWVAILLPRLQVGIFKLIWLCEFGAAKIFVSFHRLEKKKSFAFVGSETVSRLLSHTPEVIK